MKDLNYYYKHAISINEFLESFYGRCDFKGKKLVHENIHTLFPDIESVDFKEIIKNPELVYTGKVVLVRDVNNKCLPYLTSYDVEIGIDDREKLIIELVSAISKFIDQNDKSLIVLENNDSISDNVIGSTLRKISINDEEIIKINNDGGILISRYDIFTFKYLVYKCLESICLSKNINNAADLSKEKDIISINTTNSGRVYISKNGDTIELTDLLDIRNYLLKYYYPKKEEINNDLSEMELDFLMDYELEYLLKQYKKDRNTKMYFCVKMELSRRHKNYKEKNKSYRMEKNKIRMNLEEE